MPGESVQKDIEGLARRRRNLPQGGTGLTRQPARGFSLPGQRQRRQTREQDIHQRRPYPFRLATKLHARGHGSLTGAKPSCSRAHGVIISGFQAGS